jgi:hypothetical protein
MFMSIEAITTSTTARGALSRLVRLFDLETVAKPSKELSRNGAHRVGGDLRGIQSPRSQFVEWSITATPGTAEQYFSYLRQMVADCNA